MFRISFSDSLAIIGIIATIVLVALDKAGKLTGPLPVVLLSVAAGLTLPLALGNAWVSDASPNMLRMSRGLLMVSAIGLVYSALLVWISPKQTEHSSSLPVSLVQEGAQSMATGKEIPKAVIRTISPSVLLSPFNGLRQEISSLPGEDERLPEAETIFLHFVDHDVIELFGLESIYPSGSLAAPLHQLARLAVMICATRTSISAASCFETQYGLSLMRDLVPFVEMRILCAIGNAHDPLEYKDRRATKLAMFPSRFPEYTSHLFSEGPLLGRGWLGKPASSTLALASKWTAIADEQPEFWRNLYGAAGQPFTRSTMRRIRDVPERLANRPFMVSDALDALGIPGHALSIRNAVNRLISLEWVDSVGSMTGATFLVDTPYFYTDSVVPGTAPRLSVSRVNRLLSSLGLWRVLYESSPPALLNLRLLPPRVKIDIAPE